MRKAIDELQETWKPIGYNKPMDHTLTVKKAVKGYDGVSSR